MQYYPLSLRTPRSQSDVAYNILASSLGFKATANTLWLSSRVVQSVGNLLSGLPLIDDDQLDMILCLPESITELVVKLDVDLDDKFWTSDPRANTRLLYGEIVAKLTTLMDGGNGISGDEAKGPFGEANGVDSGYESGASASPSNSISSGTPVEQFSATNLLEDEDRGPETISKLCATFIERLFPCSDIQLESNQATPELAQFIDDTTYCVRVPHSVPFYALFLLSRLQRRFPSLVASGHELFLTALVIASKCLCDITFANKVWVQAAGYLFKLERLNEMEKMMLQRLNWDLNVHPEEFEAFQEKIVGHHVDEVSAFTSTSYAATSNREVADSPKWMPSSPAWNFGQIDDSFEMYQPESPNTSSSSLWQAPTFASWDFESTLETNLPIQPFGMEDEY